MKIGIVTFHCAHNYGAVLQAFALQTYLERCGHEVYVVDYRPKWLTQRYALIQRPRLRGSRFRKCWRIFAWFLALPVQLVQIAARKARRNAFQRFIDGKLNLMRCESSNDSGASLDAVVFGSDQIWNIGITNGFDPLYWGSFGSRNAIRVAYAVSAGSGVAMIGAHEACRKALACFDYIGARESSVAEFVKANGKPCCIVVDPTCLVPASVWLSMATRPLSPVPRRYILLYQVKRNDEAVRFSRRLHEVSGMPVIELCTESVFAFRRNRRFTASPSEFIWYVQNAEFVVSASFHGTVFSILSKRQFYFFGDGGRGDDRITQLLDELGLRSRYVLDADIADPTRRINYESVEMDDVSTASKRFLLEALRRK